TNAYYPGGVLEGEPATGDRQAFVPGIFGDIFDVLVATNANSSANADGTPASTAGASGRGRPATPPDAINSYRALIAGGSIEWTSAWAERLTNYVRNGGVVLLNAAQAKGLSADLLGVRLLGSAAEADNANCLAAGEASQD